MPLTGARLGLARRQLARWGRVWGIRDLAEIVSVSYSTRLTRSLGRCVPSSDSLVLHPSLQSLSPRWFSEVLCHEAAHVVAHRSGARHAHGNEWRQLMLIAGFQPRVKLHAPPTLQMPRRIRGQLRLEHFCPVCQWSRFARRKVSRWRCADCVAAGLDGHLIVTVVGE